jgi:hypothetical protein
MLAVTFCSCEYIVVHNKYIMNCTTLSGPIPLKILYDEVIYSRILSKYFREFRSTLSIVFAGEAEVRRSHVTDRTSCFLLSFLEVHRLPPPSTTLSPPVDTPIVEGPSLAFNASRTAHKSSAQLHPDHPPLLNTQHTKSERRVVGSDEGGEHTSS